MNKKTYKGPMLISKKTYKGPMLINKRLEKDFCWFLKKKTYKGPILMVNDISVICAHLVGGYMSSGSIMHMYVYVRKV